MAVLQRAGDQLRLARRAAIDQRDDRLAVRDIAGGGGDPLGVVGLVALDDGDIALVDKIVGGGYRGIEIAAGIVAQIDDEAGQLAAGLLPQILDGVGESAGCRRIECGDPDITDIAAFEARGDGREFVGGALDLDIDRAAAAAAQHQGDLAAGGTAQFLLHFVQRQIVGRFLVDAVDHVAGLDIGGCGR